MKLAGSYCIITLLFCFVSFRTLAQDGSQGATAEPVGKITGRVIDDKKQPISYATVTVLHPDSTVVTGILANEDGTFSVSSTGFGNFILRINAIGLDMKYIKDIVVSTTAPEKNMGDIKLSRDANSLKTVEVVGEKPLIQLSVDKKVFNVEKNITTAGGSALDVLQNVPSVSVDADGTVSLRGKQDVTILIDGKPATMLGTDIQSALQSLPASSIENVETITNPSAKYDAQGLTGIINIVTKKDKRLGINGNATAGVGSNNKYNANIGLSVRKGNWNVFINSSYRYNHNYNKTITDRQNVCDTCGSTHNFEEDPRTFQGFFNTVGVTYDWNTKNSLTFTQNVNFMDHSYTDYSTYTVFQSRDETGNATNYTTRTSDASGGPHSYSSAADYKHKFNKKDEELDIDATYSMATYSRQQEYNTIVYSANPRDTTHGGYYGPIKENAPTTGSNGSFNIWADYTDPLWTKNGKFSMGFKSQVLWYQSKNTPIVDSPGRPKVTDLALLNDFRYSQQIHAAYINWTDQIDKFSYQAGLRVEDAIYNGVDYIPSELDFSNNFLSLFPSAFLSYQLTKQQSIYLSYTRRTNRPSFWNMLPFKDVSNPGMVQQGNPNLEPEFINNIEFNYSKQDQKGDNIVFSTYFQYTQNLIERISTVITASDPILGAFAGRQFIQPINLASGTTYGLEGTAHLQLLPVWDLLLNFNLFQTHIITGNLDAAHQAYINDRDGMSGIAKANTNIKLPWNFSVQLNFQYESRKVIAQGYMDPAAWMDFAIRKTMLNNKLNIIFNLSDVFNSHKYTSIYDVPNIYHETYFRDRETQIGNLTVTYRFGKTSLDKLQDASKKKSKTGTGQPSQKDRENNMKENDDSPDQGTPPANNQNNKDAGKGGTRM